MLQKSQVKSAKRALSSSLQNERFARDFLQNSHFKSAKRRFVRGILQKFRRQNEGFVRELLQKSHVKDSKASILQKLSGKRHRSTHIKHSFATPAPTSNTCPHANPKVTATFTSRNLTVPCACYEKLRVHTSNTHKVLRLPRTRFLAIISHESDTSCFHPKPAPKASPNVSAIAPYCGRLRTVADGCERLRTVAVATTTSREQGSTPRTPRVKREPFATHSGKDQSLKRRQPLNVCSTGFFNAGAN